MEFKDLIVYFIIGTTVTFGITVYILRRLIPYLKSKKLGQKILDIGPRWHKNKEGTPVMGGLAFIIATTIVFALLILFAGIKDSINVKMPILCFAYALLNGLIGIIDDYTKLFKKQNQGLSAGAKYLMQFFVAVAFVLAVAYLKDFDTRLYIPFVKKTIDFGFFYYIISIIVLTGVVNAVNLTDGLDGLASGVTFVVSSFFAVMGFAMQSCGEVVFSSLMIGAAIGFLFYNYYPARIFMGDTGSLFFGGAVMGMAYIIDMPLIILVVGIIYIMEALSVVIQVSVFKITKLLTGEGKRMFKMAPFHHHLEKCGNSELGIFYSFAVITVLFSVIAYFAVV